MIDYDLLLREFGIVLGIEGMTYEDDGTCTLLVENVYPLTIFRDENRQSIVLSGVVASEMPDPMDQDLMTFLLQASLNPMLDTGPAVGLDDNGLVIAYVTVNCRDLPSKEFALAAIEFLQFLILVRERIQSRNVPSTANDALLGVRA